MIDNLALAFTRKGPFSIATEATKYAVPIFYADSTTPKVRVRDSTGWWDESEFRSVPMPPEAGPDKGSDHHLVVWDVPAGVLYEYYRMVRHSDGTWSAGVGIRFDADGPGYQSGKWELSARAYGGSLAAGAIRYCEMVAGVIPHALAVSYPFTRGDRYARGTGPGGTVAIASHNDDERDESRSHSRNIPEGARLRLKPSIDVAARAATLSGSHRRACRIIGQALQTYGAFMVDTAGAPTLYAENLQGKAVTWRGLLGTLDSTPFAASDFEVLALPPLTSSSRR